MLTLSGPSLSANCKRPFSYITRHMWAEGDRIHLVAFLLYLTRKTMFVFLLIIPPLKRGLLWNLKKEFDPTENRFFSHRIDLFSEGDKTFWKLPFTISPLRFCREIMIKKKKRFNSFQFYREGLRRRSAGASGLLHTSLLIHVITILSCSTSFNLLSFYLLVLSSDAGKVGMWWFAHMHD